MLSSKSTNTKLSEAWLFFPAIGPLLKRRVSTRRRKFQRDVASTRHTGRGSTFPGRLLLVMVMGLPCSNVVADPSRNSLPMLTYGWLLPGADISEETGHGRRHQNRLFPPPAVAAPPSAAAATNTKVTTGDAPPRAPITPVMLRPEDGDKREKDGV